MLISANHLERIWGVHPEVLIHIGAHEAEELGDYRRLGWGSKRTVWVEALPEKAEQVREITKDLPEHSVVNAVLWDTSGVELDFNETNNGQSSSALPLKEHADIYASIQVSKVWKFTTTTAREAIPFAELGEVGLVNIDIQGAELRALKGFGDELERVNAIYSEVNLRELYSGLALMDELDGWLSERGFVLVDSEILRDVGWGDALWLRKARVPPNRVALRRRRKFLNSPTHFKHFLGSVWRRMREPRAS